MVDKPWWESDRFFEEEREEATTTDVFLYQTYESIIEAIWQISKETLPTDERDPGPSHKQSLFVGGLLERVMEAKYSLPPIPPGVKPSAYEIEGTKRDIYEFLKNLSGD